MRQNFDVNRNLLSLRSFASSFKNISLKSDFIHFFMFFFHVYSPGTGAYILVTKFLLTGTACHWSFVASFKNISLQSDFIQFLLRFYTCI